MNADARVVLSPGDGHIARRVDALLFLPRPDDALLAAFGDASPGDELQAVASATVAAGFAVSPFVCLSWRDTVRVMAFGDVAVETDQPTLPMLSGAASRTWVEHSLYPDGPATITVTDDPDALDPHTALVDGVVHAGGFRLQIELGFGGPERPEGEPSTSSVAAPEFEALGGRDTTDTLPRPVPDTEPALPAPDIDSNGAPDVEADPAPAPAPRPPAGPVDADDPQAALAAIQAAAVGEDGEPLQVAHPSPAPARRSEPEPDLEPHDANFTLPPPEHAQLVEQISDAAEPRSSLVDAKQCSNGHANPPAVATCAMCGELLAPGMSTVVHVPRPRLGALRLDDGTAVPLDQELLIGRNPSRDSSSARSSLQRVRIVGDKVSRSHLEVRFQGWDVLVADCGSTNGTFIVAHPGGQVVALESDRPQMVEPGAIVYFGSRSFTVVGREDS